MGLKRTLADLGDDVREHVEEFDVDELMDAKPAVIDLQADQEARTDSPLLIDVREAVERDRGYISTSVHIARGVLERDIQKVAFDGAVRQQDLATPIVCYCGGGLRSLLAARSLQLMGFTNVVSLEGGFDAWAKSGQPIVHPRSNQQ